MSTITLRRVEPTRWLTPSEDRAWRAWLAMTERLRAQIARDLLVDSGLSDADYMVLVHLSEAEGRRVRMNDLAARLNWSKSRLSHQLARMQARGLVQREECPSDARGTFAVLGAGGLAEIERAAPKHVASVRRHLIDVLDAEQLSQLSAIAELVVGHLRPRARAQRPSKNPASRRPVVSAHQAPGRSRAKARGSATGSGTPAAQRQSTLPLTHHDSHCPPKPADCRPPASQVLSHGARLSRGAVGQEAQTSYAVADLYGSRPEPTCDVVFFSCWLSHGPRSLR